MVRPRTGIEFPSLVECADSILFPKAICQRTDSDRHTVGISDRARRERTTGFRVVSDCDSVVIREYGFLHVHLALTPDQLPARRCRAAGAHFPNRSFLCVVL